MIFVYILCAVAALAATVIIVLLLIAATKPNTFTVQRSAEIKASPEKIFALINDFKNWGSWSPWEKMDPSMRKTYDGAASGVGAITEWEGNKKVGKGRMEIIESQPSSKVKIKLDFFKPFEAHNTAEFTLQSQAGATNVTWAMHGQQPFMFKVMSLLMNMDKMIGKDFETGLASIKAQTEK